ncbi:helix-turn-helix transcriptional regulator [Vreelandella boliviensis]|uniref:helix-turn-helix transcriptional regulator n=1 Tax=Vreelandella boliviensis TaxID=223527 RepID=UPI001B8D8E09|nr:helix-turn-helix transcriptional regulator [Halomonas boliviensis]MBS3669971.1 helix-turn-helix transcriptional regulator [Halomonas boliviensis]
MTTQRDLIAEVEQGQALSGCIAALRTAQFMSSFIKLLARIVSFDCAVIVGYRLGKHPIYLYDSLQQQRELLFQRYMLHAYQHDPFLVRLEQRQEEGVFHASQVSSLNDSDKAYLEGFYQQTGWRDELCLTIGLSDTRWVVVYLGSLQNEKHFGLAQRQALTRHFDVLAALCRQHWGQEAFHLVCLSLDNDAASLLQQAVGSFGDTLLTDREQQVAALMVQGLDPQEIAECLNIGAGTVKNHRKRVYAQLGVSSLGELFGLFLNHAVAASPPPAKR